MTRPAFTRPLMLKSPARWRAALAAPVLACAVMVSAHAPALAQDEVSESRVRKIEAEIRALKSKVFPGGDPRLFEPEIRAEDSASTPARVSGPSTTAVTDILARLDAIELQMQQLTARTEENANALDLLSQRVVELETARELEEAAAEAAARAAEELIDGSSDAAADGAEDAAQAAQDAAEEESNATQSNLAAMGVAQVSEDAAEEPEDATPVGPTAERLAAVQAIAKPQSGDAADDEYSYGFRLWNAGFYPEARQQLSSFVENYSDHWRVSYGRNLLGRAYLDDGMPREAAQWFFKNYQADKQAPRAPDSLLYLAESMIALGDTRRACIALAEFGETYPALATGRLLNTYQQSKGKVTCETPEEGR